MGFLYTHIQNHIGTTKLEDRVEIYLSHSRGQNEEFIEVTMCKGEGGL